MTERKVMVGFAGGDESRDALALGDLLARTTGASLEVVRVVTPGDEDAEARLKTAVSELLVPSTVRADVRTETARHTEDGLDAAATRSGAWLIVLGSSARQGLGRVMLGGTALRLLTITSRFVAVAPRGFSNTARPLTPAGELRVIEVGFDSSPESERALEAAVELATSAQATLRVVAVEIPQPHPTVYPAPVPPIEPGADLQTRLQKAVSGLSAELRALAVFEHGPAATRILERAADRVDLLAIGSRGHGPLNRALLGSVSRTVLEHAPCPVLIAPPTEVSP